MDFRQLEVFLAVMEQSSVTRAAERVNLSPGAVSLQLHNLAAELRTELFVRSGKRIMPTPAAQQLAVRARELIRRVREIEHEFANDAASDTRPFHLATGATTLIHRLGGPLRALRKQFPNTPIQVTVSATEDMAAGLRERRFDLALISLPFEDEQLNFVPLFEEEMLILRPSANAVRGGHVGNFRPDELSASPFLLYPRRSNMRTMIDQYFREIGIDARIIMEADDTEAIKRLVEAGFGCSILPEFALRAQPRHFQVFRVPGHRLVRRQALATARSEHPRALTEAIVRFLKSALESEPRT